MPEHEGYIGIINLLTEALKLMEDGKAKLLVSKARAETARQMKQSLSSLEIGLELGNLLSKPIPEEPK
jgi:hypothetical protein